MKKSKYILILTAFLIALSLASGFAQAEIYRYTDSRGRLILSDKPPPIRPGSHTRALTKQSLSAASLSPLIRIYKYVDSKGVVHLTDKPANDNYKLIYSGHIPQGMSKKMDERADFYADLIHTTALKHTLEPALLHAVIRVESAYNPDALSHAGALGLMQLMPGTAKRYGVEDRSDPEDNLNGGAHYLRDLLRLFDNDLRLALAAYNAGENAVKRYGNKIPPYKETRFYVSKVMELYHAYRTR